MGLLEMSISAGVLILLAAAVRAAGFLHLSKRTVRLLWLIVLARLLLPFSLPVPGWAAAPARIMEGMRDRLRMETGHGAGKETVSGVLQQMPVAGTGLEDGIVIHAAWLLWIAGMAAAGIYFAVLFWKEHRLLAQAMRLESMTEAGGADSRKISEACRTARRMAGVRRKKQEQLWVHDRICSPVVFGIFRQRIVIPKELAGLEQAQMQYVLIHEMVHVKGYDNLWKLLAAAAVCIHWFNPAVWLMYVLFARDLELACDERVLSMHGSRGRQGYAATLLALAQVQKETVLFSSGFFENPVKERIVAVMKYRKLTGMGVLCAVMLLAGAASVFGSVGQAVSAQEKDAIVRDETGGKDTQEVTAGYSVSTAAGEDGIVNIQTSAGSSAEKLQVQFDKSIMADGETGEKADYTVSCRGDGTGENGKEDASGETSIYRFVSEDDGTYRLEGSDGDVYRLEDGDGGTYRLEKQDDGSTYVLQPGDGGKVTVKTLPEDGSAATDGADATADVERMGSEEIKLEKDVSES